MSINVDEKFMQLAMAEAKRAKQEGDLPFGAIVICDGEVVGKEALLTPVRSLQSAARLEGLHIALTSKS